MKFNYFVGSAGGPQIKINVATVAVVLGTVVKLIVDISAGNGPAIGADVLAIFSALGLPSLFPRPVQPTT